MIHIFEEKQELFKATGFQRLNLLLGSLAILLPSLATAEDVPQRKPNVLFIAIDDLRPSLGCYGDTLVKSPNIDRLASQSRVFMRAYCQQAVCGPSRTSLLTGRLPDNTGVWHNRNFFRDTQPELITLPQLFKENGYDVRGLGKVFSGDQRENDPASWSMPALLRAEGWDNYALPINKNRSVKGPATEQADVPDDGYPDGQLAQLAISRLEQAQRTSQPFFLAVGFFKPHLPFNAPQKYWDLYDSSVFQPDPATARTRGAPEVAYPDHLELGGYTDIPEDENLTAEQARHLRHGYYACISYVDVQVGKVLDALQRLGLVEQTIVVLWGDHGYSLGEAQHWCKDTNFEIDTHVPLMIRTPAMLEAGVATQALVEYVDLYPTLAELAGLTPPQNLDGRSLVPILNDPGRPGHELVLSQFSRPFKPSTPEVMGYSIRSDTLRYTRWIEWSRRKIISEELYDYASKQSVLLHDSFLIERANVALDPDHAETISRMRTKMDDVLKTRIDHPR